MKNLSLLLVLLVACTPKPKTAISQWVPYDQSQELAANAEHESSRMQYKLIQSKVNNKNEIWKTVGDQISDFSEEEYEQLKPLILEQDMLSLQAAVEAGELSYERLVKWYLYRIVKFENDSNKTLHTVISINPNAVKQAKRCDRKRSEGDHPLFGMPILLKDNINAKGMRTTAGAHALWNNYPQDAFIVSQIKKKGGIILGKLSLSEWANFLCNGCPNGYSAVGGQILNPYGRMQHDTGGSSSGSGTSMAANYAAAAIGTETSGSILSPSSSNSIVGLKPTVGLLSRGGIVPISSTLDTPGPMTRSVTDNAILLSAMVAKDEKDEATDQAPDDTPNYLDFAGASMQGIRVGVIERFLEDSLYQIAVAKVEELGAEVMTLAPERVQLEGFGTLLSADMKFDLADYLKKYAGPEVSVTSVADVVEYNEQDSAIRIPYGQGRFERILEDTLTMEQLIELRAEIERQGRNYFTFMDDQELDVLLSINNYTAGYAAAAKYPALTIPMGYTDARRPMGLTLIARPFQEALLLQLGYVYEQATKLRTMPEGFE